MQFPTAPPKGESEVCSDSFLLRGQTNRRYNHFTPRAECKLKIGLDFDGVIADCGKLKSDAALRLYGLDIPPGKFKKEIVVGEGLLTEPQYRDLQVQIYGTRELGFLMELVSGVDVYAPKLVEEGHTLQIVTARGDKELAIAREWSDMRGLRLEMMNVPYGQTKAAIAAGCHVFVDDDLDKLAPLVGVVPHNYLFNWEYNLAVDTAGVAKRVYSWAHLYQQVQLLSSTKQN